MSTPDPKAEAEATAALWNEHASLSHAVQTGVALMMQIDPKQVEPKHLRVGMNVALVDLSALARLLIAKGVISEHEYAAACVAAMREEVDSYRALLAHHYGRPIESITLG